MRAISIFTFSFFICATSVFANLVEVPCRDQDLRTISAGLECPNPYLKPSQKNLVQRGKVWLDQSSGLRCIQTVNAGRTLGMPGETVHTYHLISGVESLRLRITTSKVGAPTRLQSIEYFARTNF